MAYLMKRQIRGKKQWVIRWYDLRLGKGKIGQRQIVCESKGATNEVLRKQLLKQYIEIEKKIKQDVEIFGFDGIPGEKSITSVIEEYINNRMDEVRIRQTQGGRNGISKNTFRIIKTSMEIFSEYTRSKKIKKCKDLTPKRLDEFRNWLQLQKGRNVQYRSASTLNRTLRNVKTFINFHRLENTFENVDSLAKTVKLFPTSNDFPFHFKVQELQTILRSALNLDAEQCSMTREKHDAGTGFSGILPLRNAPLFPMIVIAMLSGMRKGEVLNLKWQDVDLDTGILKVRAQKTGKARMIPLNDTTHGVISPELIHLLRIWKLKAVDEYVLPHPHSDKPSEMKHPIERFRKAVKIPEFSMQNLRKNFVSYLVSFGVSPTIAALFAGHSVAVAEKHYMQFAYDRKSGNTLSDAMGISEILNDAISGYEGKGKFENLHLAKWCS